MQSDKQLDASILNKDSWAREPPTGKADKTIERFKLPSLERGKLSFSGNERNHLFQNVQGKDFRDISGISGLDTPQDGRTFAVWDYDRDGWQDIALLNVNTPVLSLFRNQQGAIQDSADNANAMVAFKFEGGNRTASGSDKFGPRDGYGARVTVNLKDRSLVRQYRCGEGLAAQNSQYLFFGVGSDRQIESAQVTWPSGIVQSIASVRAGKLVTVFENPADCPDDTGYTVSRYIVDSVARKSPPKQASTATIAALPAEGTSTLTMYTSMATWCPNCLKQIPQLRRLRDRFTDAELNILGAPIDATESQSDLANYLAEHKPPYEMPSQWNAVMMSNFSQLAIENVGADVLPTSIILGESGEVLSAYAGVPTVSDIRKMLSDMPKQAP